MKASYVTLVLHPLDHVIDRIIGEIGLQNCSDNSHRVALPNVFFYYAANCCLYDLRVMLSVSIVLAQVSLLLLVELTQK